MNPLYYEDMIRQALNEDIGFQDLTTETIIPEDHFSAARISAKAEGIIAGLDIAKKVFTMLDEKVDFRASVQEGERVFPGQAVAVIEGRTRALLSGERVALNLLQRMSGIATETNKAAECIKDFDCHIVDTRKTMPGLRGLDKYAVKTGGGYNHRFGLFDAILIKDNHIAAAGGITEAVNLVRAKVGHMVKVEVETETIEQVKEALQNPVDIIMLDNMSTELMKQAVQLINRKVLVEASGGITFDSLVEIASTGVDLISLGWLTHSVRALDLSLNIVSGEKSHV